MKRRIQRAAFFLALLFPALLLAGCKGESLLIRCDLDGGVQSLDPQFTEEEAADTSEETVPYLESMVIHDAMGHLRQLGLDYKIVGDGVTVLKQVPSVTEQIPKGGTVVLFTDEASLESTVSIPSVVGMTPQEANQAIYAAGLNIRLTGEDIS